jgi:Arc/MetJ family transcription regulator
VKPVQRTPSGPRKRKSAKPGVRTSREGKVRKEFWLDPDLLRAAQEYLGASTEREAVEMALDLVAFRKELGEGARALRRLSLSRID